MATAGLGSTFSVWFSCCLCLFVARSALHVTVALFRGSCVCASAHVYAPCTHDESENRIWFKAQFLSINTHSSKPLMGMALFDCASRAQSMGINIWHFVYYYLVVTRRRNRHETNHRKFIRDSYFNFIIYSSFALPMPHFSVGNTQTGSIYFPCRRYALVSLVLSISFIFHAYWVMLCGCFTWAPRVFLRSC